VLIVPCTGATAGSRFPGTVLIQPDKQNGLTKPSLALGFQLRALDKRRFLKRLVVLSPMTFQQVAVSVADLMA